MGWTSYCLILWVIELCLCFGQWDLHDILVLKSFRFIFICFVGRLQAVATLGTYDIALELGKKVICQRYLSISL